MQFKVPKDDAKYHWTQHVVRKMMHYGLSADRIRRVIRAPARAEKGVAEHTVAVMQKAGTAKRPSEIWVMYSDVGKSEKKKLSFDKLRTPSSQTSRKVIITAWRYPGISPVREQMPIPADIMAELKKEHFI